MAKSSITCSDPCIVGNGIFSLPSKLGLRPLNQCHLHCAAHLWPMILMIKVDNRAASSAAQAERFKAWHASCTRNNLKGDICHLR
jgi:hypothetical protein